MHRDGQFVSNRTEEDDTEENTAESEEDNNYFQIPSESITETLPKDELLVNTVKLIENCFQRFDTDHASFNCYSLEYGYVFNHICLYRLELSTLWSRYKTCGF